MKKFILKKSLPLLLAFVLVVSMMSGAALAAPDYEFEKSEIEIELEQEQLILDEGEVPLAPQQAMSTQSNYVDTLNGGSVIWQNGEYDLAPNATGHITVANGVSWAKIVGDGVTIVNGLITSPSFDNLTFDCTASPGITFVLEDIFLYNMGGSSGIGDHSTIDFAGTDNVLEIMGTVVMDYIVGGGSNPAGIHVVQGTSLTIAGDGTLYFYKSAQGSGIGGDSGQLNGDITFEMTGSAFMKGTKQGALIGAGSGTASGMPGSVTFNSGTYNLISNSRGAVIGGSAGSLASAGTEVFFNGGSVNINVDFTGSAVGGGGYAVGNDAAGGNAYFSGGSLRVYVDRNAAGNTNWGVMSEGVNDLAVTALKQDANGVSVYKCAFDTTLLDVQSDYFVVDVDGTPFFEGGLHEYSFIQELLDKGEQHTITSTPSNWVPGSDSHLYFYLPATAQTLTVNDEEFELTFVSEIVGTPEEHSDGPFIVGEVFAQPAAPVITTQPTGAVYNVPGTTVSALTVAASVSDGGTLSYQWFVNSANNTSNATDIAGATNAAFTPPIHTTGTAYYFCRVTNTLGGAVSHTVSDIAAVTVNITWDRDLDFSWYNTTAPILYINSVAKWDALAWIVGGHIGNIGSYETKFGLNIIGTPPALTDTFEGRTIRLSADLDFSILAATQLKAKSQFLPVGGRYYYEDQLFEYKPLVDPLHPIQFNGVFMGNFDGQNNTVTGIDADYSVNGGIIGLIGIVDGDSIIKNVRVEGSFTVQRAGSVVGGIVGRFGSQENNNPPGEVFTGYIANCVNAANIDATGNGSQGTGGIAGAYWFGSGIFNCANLGTVTTNGAGLGGIVGNMQSGVIDSCYNKGNVIMNGEFWAGIAMVSPTGGATYESYLNNCYYDNTLVPPYGTPRGVVQSNQADITALYTNANPALLEPVNIGAMNTTAKAAFAAQLNGGVAGTWVVNLNGEVVPGLLTDYNITMNNATNRTATTTVRSTGIGITTFKVTSAVACAVVYSTDGGTTYTRLTATATGAANTYSFTINVTTDIIIAVVVKGDVNFSGGITAIDAALVKSASQALMSLNTLQSIAADVNNSGTVTAIDAALVNAAAQQQTSFSW